MIDTNGSKISHVASGSLRFGDGDFTESLRSIFQQVGAIVTEYSPDQVSVERVFMNKNADSALKLGHARAAAICATFAAAPSLHEYSAREIKQAVTGGGGAQKQQVQHMVKAILALQEHPESDAADALAAAICHAHSARFGPAQMPVAGATRRRSGRNSWRKFAG